ncbi:MAG: hypothetical protein A3H44_01900 [Gammaproteobacteria bacterium RIFCSPLOWO2_02_FULL_57_10]|nr:MAG: hypothetical protein A3H44_01900 [Gammaproteobacteria bacterium RIFCSPLOWO2_02_FULL_57_10]
MKSPILKTNTIVLLVGAATLLAGTSFAASSITRNHNVDVEGIEEIVLEGGVGSMKIETATGSEMQIELDIEADRNWWGRRRDVDDIDVEISRSGDRLTIEVNEHDLDNLELHWRVALPEVERTSIHLGVGQIIAEVGNTELNVDLGVGEARISAPLQHAGRVETSAGVGDASIEGGSDTVNDRAFVSANSRAHGDGSRDVDVQVGVGDVSVSLSSN